MIRRDEQGFTLIELLVTMALAAVLMTIGVVALRHYWLVHALHGARDEAMTHLRAQQERVVSESHPLVFGARFRTGSSEWALVEYDPTTGQCQETRTMKFDNSVRVQTVDFLETGSMSEIVTECRTDLGVGSTDEFAMFFARGTASSGNLILEQPSLGRTLELTVKPITGRVEESP